MKKVIKGLMGIVILFAMNQLFAFGQTIIYENRSDTRLSEGIVYSHIYKETTSGPIQMHLVEIDLTHDEIDIKPIFNNELSQRAPLSKIASEWHASAAINGDFFRMGTPSFPFGPIVDQGRIISSPNSPSLEFPTIMRHSDGFNFQVLKPKLRVIIPGKRIPLHMINKAGTINKEMILLTSAWGDKSLGDTWNEKLVEVLVADHQVKEIRIAGEPFEFSDNQYVLVFNANNKELLGQFTEGMPISLELDLGFDIDEHLWAAGGVNHLVKDGEIHQYHLSILGRHPRTTIGFSQDQQKVFFLTVDGRSQDSIGMLQSELAQTMIDLGAWNVINLDGGGSSQMTIDLFKEGDSQVVNKPSDGFPRPIVSGFGAFHYFPIDGPVREIEVVLENQGIFKGQRLDFYVKAFNQYQVSRKVQMGETQFFVQNLKHVRDSEGIRFTESGDAIIQVQYMGLTTEIAVKVYERVQAFKGTVKPIQVDFNESIELPSFIGLDGYGNQGVLSSEEIQWQVDPSLGVIRNGVYLSGNTVARGFIKGQYDDAVIHIPVYVGFEHRVIHEFDQLNGLLMNQYPENSEGRMILFPRSITGRQSLKLFYDFTKMHDDDQAIAFVEFGDQGMLLPGEPTRLSLWVFGDNSNHWLRTRIIDGNGNIHRIDFAKEVDWFGWREVVAHIPDNIKYPIRIKNIYIANIHDDKKDSGAIYFDQLIAHYPQQKFLEEEMPKNTRWKDFLRIKPEQVESTFSINRESVKWKNLPSEESLEQAVKIFTVSIPEGGIRKLDEEALVILSRLEQYQNQTIIFNINRSYRKLSQNDQRFFARISENLTRNNKNTVYIVFPETRSGQTRMLNGVRYVAYMEKMNFYWHNNQLYYSEPK